jgi:branched-subunit amino acid aminotransferase/4-amino-4-deoxychorismate lyase
VATPTPRTPAAAPQTATPWIDYCNGAWLPADQVSVSTADMGFTMGDAVFEATRTYRQRPFHLDWHLDRLYASLAYARIDPGLTRDAMEGVTLETLARNVGALRPHEDLTITHRITRGLFPGVFAGRPPGPPTVLIMCRPTAAPRFARFYDEGVDLVVPSVRVPAAGGLDPRVKTQSRFLFSLGATEVADADGRILPLFADTDGHVTESSGSNVFFVAKETLVTPPDEVVLGGITRRVVLALARELRIEVRIRPTHVDELAAMDEAFVTSTGPGILPVRRIDEARLAPIPGPMTRRLLAAFNRYVGVDIVALARAHLTPGG